MIYEYLEMIESLEKVSAYPVNWDRLAKIQLHWNADTKEFFASELELLIYNLEINKLDPITSGFPYNQTDIKKHLNKLL